MSWQMMHRKSTALAKAKMKPAVTNTFLAVTAHPAMRVVN
jgi:hypothetical protein